MRFRWRPWAVVLGVVVSVALGLAACGDDAPLHERHCDNGRDDDGDGRVDCDDSDCWGTPECPAASCGDGEVSGLEECDGADLDGRTCQGLGYDGGVLACSGECLLDLTGCTGDAVCGNGIIDGDEECDGASLGSGSCVDFGYEGGTLTCDASCLYDVTPCVGRLLAECYDYGDLTGGVDGQLTCGSEVGVLQWDSYSVTVAAGDCVDVVVDNGAGGADLVAYAVDADTITAYGLAGDYSQLDDELACDQDPWSGWACPAATMEAETAGSFLIYVGQWYEETGTAPGVDTCSLGLSAYTLFVAVNGDATPVTLVADDQPL